MDNPSRLIPLSVLQLDLDPPSTAAYLADRGIPLVFDDIGRLSVRRDDARQLITERREVEAQQREAAKAAERDAVERDQQWRAQLWTGVPASAIPEGVRPAAAMFAADRDQRPRRLTPLEEALSNTGELAFHPIREEDDEWVVGGGDG